MNALREALRWCSSCSLSLPTPSALAAGRAIGLLALVALLGGCAGLHPEALPGSAPYSIGPYHVVIESQERVDVDCFEGRRPGAETFACYKPWNRTIYSIPDPYVLAHEFKHALEGWDDHAGLSRTDRRCGAGRPDLLQDRATCPPMPAR